MVTNIFAGRRAPLPAPPRAWQCQCKRVVFFLNSVCLACGTPLGYEPSSFRLLPLKPGPKEGTWTAFGARKRNPELYRRCANFETAAGCNWLVKDGGDALCMCCRLNRTIPDLSVAGNDVLWHRIEVAKRRVISSLVALGLPLCSKTDDPTCGLAFDLLADPPGGPRVLTGHDNGVITINIEEAEDSRREQTRIEMGEQYRTLVGHVRHELGHYYWDRLVRDTKWLEPFRELFGDEQADYCEALRIKREQGPPPDWPQHYISHYASSHPWEDWAETWAHYMHMLDTLATGMSFGIGRDSVDLPFEPFTKEVLWQPESVEFLDLLNSWIRLSTVLNEMARAMGQHDFYPFALPKLAGTKLQFIHAVIAAHAQQASAPQVLSANP
jgi:hypothetical protein